MDSERVGEGLEARGGRRWRSCPNSESEIGVDAMIPEASSTTVEVDGSVANTSVFGFVFSTEPWLC